MRARDNPFRTEAVLKLRYMMPAGVNFEVLTQRFKALSNRAALVAPHGHGKTTLINEFCDHLRQNGQHVSHIVLNEDNANKAKQKCNALLDSADENSIIAVDGAEQFGRFEWWQFARRTRRCRGLLITTHRLGRLPPLLHCGTSVDLLRRIVEQLAPQHSDALQDDLHELFHKHAGDIRQCLRDLYNRC